TGGSLHAQEQVDWPPSMVVCNGLPPDPDIVGDDWFAQWMDRLEKTPQWPGIWLRHQRRDEYWLHGSPCADYAAIQCPTLLIGGWVDGYVDGMLAMTQHLTCPTRTVIGPWGHFRPATGCPGPALDHLDLLARWFGHHLRGDENGVMDMPPVTAFIRTGTPYDGPTSSPFDHPPTPGYWRAEPVWPPADAIVVEMPLDDLRHGATNWSRPQWVGVHAPAWDRAGRGSSDSTDDDAHSLTFETAPLEEQLEILGTPEIEVMVASDKPVGLVAARLLAVSPTDDGHLITRGSRNLAFPDDLSTPLPITPGTPTSVRFPLMATSAVLPAGWRLRLALSGADFPVVWPPGERFTLSLDPSDSKIRLPTVPVRGDESQVSIPVPSPLPQPPGLEDEDRGRAAVERVGSTTTYARHRYAKEVQPQRAGLTYVSDENWTVSVDDDDPSSTRARAEAESTMERPGWKVATRGSLELSGDSDSFYLVIHLTALLDDQVVFSRTWSETVPREWA
ncbi:MAG TPA: CocE/NonD family hydrolase, partial [Acidimicrobiia bacterium]|nr:CocE/NonD family hydrolase [Acidimicrobiia bacterium]